MRQPRIAIIGDTRLLHGELTDAGAIALELASGWPVDVGFRSVADTAAAWELVDERFGAAGVTTWLTIRNAEGDRPADSPVATVRMGDMLNIDELFGHDLVIVATAMSRSAASSPISRCTPTRGCACSR